MAYLTSLHTHSTFCDGKNTVREMIDEAVRLGFDSIGISSHAYTGYPFDVCGIKKEKVEDYFNTVLSLKNEYRGRISVFCGLELESRTEGETRPGIDSRLDYTIGSVHLFRKNGRFISVDNTPEEWKEALALYSGDHLSLIESYLEELAAFSEEYPFDIVGHYDLYTKFNEKEHLFDENGKTYRALAIKYLDRIILTGKIIEINTGAMSRGWRTAPYPAFFLLEHMKKKGARVIINSDSHSVTTLSYGYDTARRLLHDAGYLKQTVLTEKGWTEVEI